MAGQHAQARRSEKYPHPSLSRCGGEGGDAGRVATSGEQDGSGAPAG